MTDKQMKNTLQGLLIVATTICAVARADGAAFFFGVMLVLSCS